MSNVYRTLKKVELRYWKTHPFERWSFRLKGCLSSSRYLLLRIQTISRGNSNDLFDGSIIAGLVAGINQYRQNPKHETHVCSPVPTSSIIVNPDRTMKHISDLKIGTSPEQTMKFRESIFINRTILNPGGHISLRTSRFYLNDLKGNFQSLTGPRQTGQSRICIGYPSLI